MVDFIKDNFAIWAKYQNRPIGEDWETFAERVVGIDDDGNVIYKNAEAAQVEDDGSVARGLYRYDNSFGGVVFGDTGVKTRISVDAWDNLESYDGSDSRVIASYDGTPSDDDVMYYDTTDGEWKLGDASTIHNHSGVYSPIGHNHHSLYVNVVGGDSMEGPFTVSTDSVSITLGNINVDVGNIVLDEGSIGVALGDIDIAAGTLDVHGNAYLVTGGAAGVLIGAAVEAPREMLDVRGNIVIGAGSILKIRNTVDGGSISVLQVDSGDDIVLGNIGYQLEIQADSTSDLVLLKHDSRTDGYLAPFAGLGSWANGHIPIWDSGSKDFYALDPATITPEWDKILDNNESLLGTLDDDSTTKNLLVIDNDDMFNLGSSDLGITMRGTNPIILGTVDVNIIAGDDIYFTASDSIEITCGDSLGDKIIMDGDKLESLTNWHFPNYNTGILFYHGSSVYGMIMNSSGHLLIGDSSVVKLNLRGDPTRPQYNGADLALYSDTGLGGSDPDAIHDNVANEITAIAAKTTLVDADECILEDSEASFVKKAVTASNFSAYVQAKLDGVFLPLTAGSSYPLAGDLYIEQATNPSLYFREDGSTTNFTRMYDNGLTALYIENFTDAGEDSLIFLRSNPGSSAGSAYMRFNQGGNASLANYYQFYGPDRTTLVAQITGDAANDGYFELYGGDTHIRLQHSSNNFFNVAVTDPATTFIGHHKGTTGTASIHIAAKPQLDSSAVIGFGWATGAVAASYLYLYDDTTPTAKFSMHTGDVELCMDAGILTIGGGGVTGNETLTVCGGSVLIDNGEFYMGKASNDAEVQLIGFEYETDDIMVGTAAATLRFRGSETRPVYGVAEDELALLSDVTGGYLPLSAGAGSPLTGNLYIESVSDPSVFLREDGDTESYARIWDNGINILYFEKFSSATQNAYVYLRGNPASSAKDSFIRFNYGGLAADDTYYQFYAGDKSTMAAQITGLGQLDLRGSQAMVVLNEHGTANSYADIYDAGSTLFLRKREPTGSTTISLIPIADDHTSAAGILMFRNTNTTGNVSLIMYKGDGTSAVQHRIYVGATAGADFCLLGGDLRVGDVVVSLEGHTHGAGSDPTAIHDNVAAEINAITGKGSPHYDDVMLIEDSENSWAKKKVELLDLASFMYDELSDSFAPISHSHNDLYYTETEIDTALALYYTKALLDGGALNGIYYTETEIDTRFGDYLPLTAGVGQQLVGDLYFDYNYGILIQNHLGVNRTGLGIDNADIMQVGSSSAVGLNLKGGWTRPKWNNNNLALFSDIPTGGPWLPLSGGEITDTVILEYQVNLMTDDSGGTPQGALICTGNYLRLGATSLITSIRGISGAAGAPSNQFPSGQWGIHKNATDSKVYFCYNDGGTMKAVELTASPFHT